MFESWVNLSEQFFDDLSKTWNKGELNSFNHEEFEKSMEQVNSTWVLAIKSWESFLGSLKNPDETFLSEKSMEERRKALEAIMNSMSETFKIFQEKSKEQFEGLKNNFTAFDFTKIDKGLFKKWESFYEKELSRILGMPQVGLGREYNEKIATALDKFNLFNSAVIEFLYFLYLPMEKTFIFMQKDLEKMMAEGKLPENSEEYYNIWLKKLEANYMSMFHSSEYVSVMAKTLENMAQFKSARDAVLEDFLSTLPIPTKSELDELYKEISELKRTVKKLEKKAKNN
ncbi:MAG: poly(R)-hydroxyalkanoic acid synthase subunit PhaE [Desulforegulaceae bacterium]|nr:poly(R)-hydroxyalkanoic acid synthase subunit PhaE [Desulforegulaceae bacterium]